MQILCDHDEPMVFITDMINANHKICISVLRLSQEYKKLCKAFSKLFHKIHEQQEKEIHISRTAYA